MSTLSLRLPESLHQALRELARREGVSINQLVTSAVGEKLAALLTEEFLEARAARGRRELYERVLAKVPDVEPELADRIADAPPGANSGGNTRVKVTPRRLAPRGRKSKERR